MEDIKKLDLKDFREFGILQEVNRQFFHPRGLALYVNVDEEDNVTLGGILDFRGDPEGVYYGKGHITEEKKLYTRRLFEMKKDARIALFGSQIQQK